MIAQIEHINFTVSNAQGTAEQLCRLFGWKVRWAGPSIHGGHSVHVGSRNQYLAVYSRVEPKPGIRDNYVSDNGLNHIGIVVDNLDAAEARIIRAGYAPYAHADYEPGRRFYFRDDDGVEFEVISYAQSKPNNPTLWSWLGQLGRNGAIMK